MYVGPDVYVVVPTNCFSQPHEPSQFSVQSFPQLTHGHAVNVSRPFELFAQRLGKLLTLTESFGPRTPILVHSIGVLGPPHYSTASVSRLSRAYFG
jgi:hypothetical protein